MLTFSEHSPINAYLQHISVATHLKMSEKAPSESFHSDTHAFDPLGYIKDFYSGSYACRLEQEIFEWLYDKVHNLFVEGR